MGCEIWDDELNIIFITVIKIYRILVSCPSNESVAFASIYNFMIQGYPLKHRIVSIILILERLRCAAQACIILCKRSQNDPTSTVSVVKSSAKPTVRTPLFDTFIICSQVRGSILQRNLLMPTLLETMCQRHSRNGAMTLIA